MSAAGRCGSGARVRAKGKGGTVEIDYADPVQLDALLERLGVAGSWVTVKLDGKGHVGGTLAPPAVAAPPSLRKSRRPIPPPCGLSVLIWAPHVRRWGQRLQEAPRGASRQVRRSPTGAEGAGGARYAGQPEEAVSR